MKSSTLVTHILLLGLSLDIAAAAPSYAATNVEAKKVREKNRRQTSKGRLPYSKRERVGVQEQQQLDHYDHRAMPWASIVILISILFFFRSFAAPFFDPLGEPRKETASSVYFSLLSALYIWLASVTTLTVLPQFSTKYNIIIAAALFFYMVFVSIIALLVGRFIIRGAYYLWLLEQSRIDDIIFTLSNFAGYSKGKHISTNGGDKDAYAEAIQTTKQFPALIAFQRPFRRVFKSSLFLSAVLCFLYSHCWSRSLSAFNVSRDEGASILCQAAFLPMLLFSSDAESEGTNSCYANRTCVYERSIWVLWAFVIIGFLFYYGYHEFTGKHHKFATYTSTPSDAAAGMEATSKSSSSLDIDLAVGTDSDEHDADGEDEDESHHLWGQVIQKFTKKPEQPKGTLPMVSWYSQIVFTTGFDMLLSFKVFLGRFDARAMHAALLKEKKSETNKSGDSTEPEGIFDFSHCSHYNPDNTEKEEGFWFDFVSDCGDGFNSSYQISRLLAQPTLDIAVPSSGSFRKLPRGKLMVNGGDLAYPDPTPENFEQRFFRTYEDAMPPPPSFRKEHISIHKPALPVKGWTDTETDAKDESSDLSSYQGPCAFLIPGNHDWFDGLTTYTRYILSRDWLGGWLMPQRTSYFALRLKHGWWLLGFDLALDDDINIEQFQFFANLAEKSMGPDDAAIVVSHVPHWVLNEYENHDNDASKETNLSELIRTHLRGRVKLRLAGDLHHYTRHIPLNDKWAGPIKLKSNGEENPLLIVSGGGGAFLHPTHCFQDTITVGKEKQEYVRVCAFPSTKVSRHLSWMNLWQFRWRNWRLDILWAITHFGICSSLFPLCGVFADYLEYNPNHNIGYLLLWVMKRIMSLLAQIFISGRASLFFTLVMIGIGCTFTDSSNLKWRTHLAWSLMHSLAHISSALTCLLFVECMAEFVVSEGLVVTQDVDGAENASCGTGLAASIYDEFTTHFSHTLEDFHLLNNYTNSTIFRDPPDLFPSCRFDESFYNIVSNTLSWLYHEAPFLKTTLAVFDLPGVISNTHVEMCDVLCFGGVECTYSNDYLRYQQLDRGTILMYLASISLYFIIFAVPVAGNVFGTWLAITLNYFNCQYDEGFSSLRMEHWKNFLRLHIDDKGDLEIFAIGLHRIPKKWRRDPSWDGDCMVNSSGEPSASTKPSWMWKTPSKWKEWRHKKKFAPQLIDYTKIQR